MPRAASRIDGFCGAAGPGTRHGSGSVQGDGGAGGAKRFVPPVVAPKGTPRKTWIPSATSPATGPAGVVAIGAVGRCSVAVIVAPPWVSDRTRLGAGRPPAPHTG